MRSSRNGKTEGRSLSDADPTSRLVWKGTKLVNIPAPCKYLSEEDGGVSHFNYLRDNIFLTWMYARLLCGFLLRLPLLLWRKLTKKSSSS